MAGVAALLAQARAAGLVVAADADELVVRGHPDQAALARRLLERKAEVMTLLATEEGKIAWRVAAMRTQVPPRGPIPFLIARDVPEAAGRCRSCGDPLGAETSLRCRRCAQAAWFVLHADREGMAS